MQKIACTAIVLAVIGAAPGAFAQNAPLPGGVSNAPPGTTYSGNKPDLPPSTTGTPRPGALDGNNATAETAAKRYKFAQAGFHDVKGLARQPDGTWTGRGVRGGVEVGVAMDPAGNIRTF